MANWTQDHVTVTGSFTFAQTRYYTIPASSANLGPTSPGFLVNGSFSGLEFDADADVCYLNWEIPDDYDGTTDMTLKIYWMPEVGSPIAQGKKVKWDISYRVVAWGTDDTDTGSVETGTVTYTEAANPGDENDTHESEITLSQNGTNQDLVAGEVLGIQFDRDVTGEAGDTYGGGAIVTRWEIAYASTGIPNHY